MVTLAETTDDHGNDKSNVGTREFLKVSLMILVLITHWRCPIQLRPVIRYGNRGYQEQALGYVGPRDQLT